MRPTLILAALSLVATATAAAAQPGVTPPGGPSTMPIPAAQPPATIEITEKNPNTALILSLGGTLGAYAIMGSNTDNAILTTAGGLGMWLAPSFGHWYAGDGWTTGLTYRVAGSAAMFGGLMWVMTECVASHGDGGGGGDECGAGGFVLLAGGAAAFVGGSIYDIATAPRAARRHNQRERERLRPFTVAPTLRGDRVGFAVSGRF